ncbi:MAG: hypothetical protein ACO1SV_18720 [Fimbriimonas sp.]
MRKASLLGLAFVMGLLALAGCGSQGEVSSKDAANFSKTPDGKGDDMSKVNNDR